MSHGKLIRSPDCSSGVSSESIWPLAPVTSGGLAPSRSIAKKAGAERAFARPPLPPFFFLEVDDVLHIFILVLFLTTKHYSSSVLELENSVQYNY